AEGVGRPDVAARHRTGPRRRPGRPRRRVRRAQCDAHGAGESLLGRRAGRHAARDRPAQPVALYPQGLPAVAWDPLWSSFQQVADWKRADRNSLGKGLEWNHPRESEAFKDWLSSRSKPLIPK